MSSLMLRRTKEQLQINGDLQELPQRDWQLIETRLDVQELDVYHKVLVFLRTLFGQFLAKQTSAN